jgi:hypothetical protein
VSNRQPPAASPAPVLITHATSDDPQFSARPTSSHEVRIIDGRFAYATCTCGWRSAGRRLRETAKSEGHDHALLYAGSS